MTYCDKTKDAVKSQSEEKCGTTAFAQRAEECSAEESILHEKYMKQAIKLAKKAAGIEEVPIGCVIVRDGRIIARGYNRRTIDHSTLAHAEMQAIKKACKVVGDWRLEDCVMYVTLEPCPMCAGAIVQARIPKVVIGCMNPKAGSCGSVVDLLHQSGFNHQVEEIIGVCEEECSEMMKEFFRKLRKKTVD